MKIFLNINSFEYWLRICESNIKIIPTKKTNILCLLKLFCNSDLSAKQPPTKLIIRI